MIPEKRTEKEKEEEEESCLLMEATICREAQ